MAGKTKDVTLQPEDILFIPDSSAKAMGYRTVDSIMSLVVGAAIYGRF